MKEKRVTYTLKQEKAIQHYLINGDKTAAYRDAYSTSRMKPATINRIAKRLFDLPKICTRIEQEHKDTYKRNHATIDEALSILADNLRTDPSLIFNADGTIKKMADIPKEIRLAISGFRLKDGKIIEIKFNSKSSFMDMTLKHLGGYEKDNKQQQDNITIFEIPDNGR